MATHHETSISSKFIYLFDEQECDTSEVLAWAESVGLAADNWYTKDNDALERCAYWNEIPNPDARHPRRQLWALIDDTQEGPRWLAVDLVAS